jgi:hypothetical protein
MKKRQILWAIVLGSMLAITGCGDDETGGGNGTGATGGDGTGATGGGGTGATGGGGSASSTCEAICGNCGAASADCESGCEEGLTDDIFADCPSELNALSSCVEANGCQSLGFSCVTEYLAWISCAFGTPI